MRVVEETLRIALGDREMSFVFPSEICADFWLRRAAAGLAGPDSRPRALPASRFLGWDSFKELAFGDPGSRAADSFFRAIFAARLLADNADAPFLRELLPPERAAGWAPFAPYVAARLPALGSLAEAARSGRTAAARSPLVADWLEVHRRYADFLAAKGRVEPSYGRRASAALPGRYTIFFPSLIDDFEEYRGLLAATGRVGLVELPRGGSGFRLERPATALAEIRETLREIGELLDRGVDPDGIAVTVPGLDSYRPFLEREAELLSVPLALRSGSALSATPGGRLFAALGAASSSGYAFDAMRDLLSSPAWPWRYPARNRALLEAGSRLHAIAPWPEEGRNADPWERGLGESDRPGDADLLRGYTSLRAAIAAVAGARDFGGLRSAFLAFRRERLADEGWDELASLTLARCVETLERLASLQAELEVEVPNPFSLFLRTIESETYVPKGVSGVAVYEWRVAAGIAPERHFVLGAAQDSLAVPLRRFDFLGERSRRELGAEDLDAGADFIEAYAASGARVSFSCPAKGLAGEQAPHGVLVSRAAEAEAEASPRADDYAAESSWLAAQSPAPARLHAVQLAGLEAALAAPPCAPSACGPGGRAGAFLRSDVAHNAASRLRRRGEGRLRLNATALDAYSSCPYAFLYQRLLGASPESSGIAFVDDIFIGEVYHAALELLFARIREQDGRFRPERRAEYARWIGEALDEAAAELARRRGGFVRAVLEAFRERLELFLGQLLDAEAERFPNLEVACLEESFEAEYPELDTDPFPGGLILDGRVDRISLREGRAVIVDYKKGNLPSRADAAPDEDGELAAAQLPCYLKLAAARAGDAEAPWSGVDSAWYVSIEGGSRRQPGAADCAFGDDPSAWVPGEGLREVLARLDELVARIASGILEGEYPFVEKSSQARACGGCGARGICRERYAIRLG